MNIKSFILLVVALLAMSTVFADTEYLYELEIDYDFDENEEIECKLDLGDSKKTKTFDEDDDRNDMTFDGRFDDDISVDCDEKVDIDFRVLDLEDNEIEDLRETDTKSFYYELQLFEAIIDLDYDFPSNVDTLNCVLDKDEGVEEFTYDRSDDTTVSEEIEFEFLKELNFDCSEDLDQLRLRVENPLGKDVYDLYLEDESEISFDEATPRHEFDIAIFFTKNFEDDTECDIDIDSDSEFTIEFDDSTSGSERQLEYVFGNSFTVNCDEEFQEVFVDIQLLEDDNVKVLQAEYFDTNSFTITRGDIDRYEEEKNQPEEKEEVEEKPDKVIIPEVVNPQIEEKEEPSKEVSESANDNQNNNIETTEENQTNSTTTPINSTQDTSEVTEEQSKPMNLVYVFIGIVSIILVIAIVVLVIKL
jgi:hypothetical protein